MVDFLEYFRFIFRFISQTSSFQLGVVHTPKGDPQLNVCVSHPQRFLWADECILGLGAIIRHNDGLISDFLFVSLLFLCFWRRGPQRTGASAAAV